MIDPNRRVIFSDLYRLAEFYENPGFRPGDIEGNANWFVMAQEKALMPFLQKYQGNQLAIDLANAILSEADRLAAAMNKKTQK